MLLKTSMTLIAILWFSYVNAQIQVKGKVVEMNEKHEHFALPYAQINWLGTKEGTVSDEKGNFSIKQSEKTKLLVISYTGFTSDTVTVNDPNKELLIMLKKGIEFDETIILRRRKSSEISKLSPKLTIELGRAELQKAACCNLSESFETTPSIDVSFTDAITGSKQIKMLGLDGIYTQITREMMPGIRGMASPYGMQFVPGSWIHSIQLTKGVGSVINGFESMAGQINLEIKKPDDEEHFFMDAYVNQAARSELNIGKNFKLNNHLYTGIMAHASTRPFHTDMNKDGFADNPTGVQANFLNRWRYFTDKGWEGMFGIQGIYDQRSGGQTSYLDKGEQSGGYGVNVINKGAEFWAKNGYVFKDKPYQSFGSQISFKWHSLGSDYGNPLKNIQMVSPGADTGLVSSKTNYTGTQKSIYTNLLFASIIGTTIHSYTTGLSFQSDIFDENIDRFGKINKYGRTENVVGSFIEYTYKPTDKLSVVSGMRADYNNLFGWFFTPRLHMRYLFNKDMTVIRISGGRGQRTSNVFAENQRMFGSNRQISVLSSIKNNAYNLLPEVSWNYGLSLSHEFKVVYRAASVNIDFFRTDFVQQVIADYDFHSNQVLFYNLEGKSYANSFQSMFELEPIKRFDIKIAYRWFDVKTDQKSGNFSKALLSPHRAFLNLAYKTKSKWIFDYTAQWYGPSRMPITKMSPEEFKQPFNSKSFVLMNAQVSKQINKTTIVYLGGENITNYRQQKPIVSSQNPFNQNFDTSMVWGPIFGAMIYGGFRWNIKNKEIIKK